MKTRTLSLLVAAGAAAALASIGISRGAGVVPITSYFLRSEEELLSLRWLLREPAAWTPIESLAAQMALWKVASETVPAAPEEACLPLSTAGGPGEKAQHRFEFASRKGMSTRIYRMDYHTCKKGPGEYSLELKHSGFGSDFKLGPEPIVRGPSPLRVLRLALEDADVLAELIRTLREKDIAFCQVVEDRESAPGGSATDLYRLLAADGMPGEPGTTVVLEYRAEYDPAAEAASFERIR